MTGPDRSKLPHGLRIPVSSNGDLSVNISKLGTLGRFPEKYDYIFMLCGRIILEWSTTQNILDVLICQTWRNEIVEGIEDQEKPKSLKRKLAFLRKAYRPDGPLADVSSEGRNIIKFTNQIGKNRHDVAHLHLQTIEEREDGQTYLTMYNLEGRAICVTVGQVVDLLHDVYATQNSLLAISFNHAALFYKVAPSEMPEGEQ